MSGHWRLCGTACLLFAGLSTWPASSNPLTDLLNPAPKEAAAPAPVAVRDECVSQPGRSTAPGRHWVYHLNGHRRCWYQANEATFSAKKQIRHHFARRRAVVHEEDEAELRQETVLDARAQMLSAAATGAPQSAASAPEVVDTASVRAREAATAVPAAPVAAQPTIDSLAPNRATPRSVDVEMLLAASTDSDMAASSVPPATAEVPSAASADTWELTAARAGTVLITLGFVLLAGALLASRALGPRETSIRRA
jgi:hypothetical protein